MKIIVANQVEKDLIKTFIKAISDLDIYYELHKIDCECMDENQYFNDCNELKVLESGLNDAEILIDESESEICIEDDDIITGICKFCGVRTHGREDNNDPISYSEYLKSISDDEQENWTCYECYRRICECCGEKLTNDDDETECADCLANKGENND